MNTLDLKNRDIVLSDLALVLSQIGSVLDYAKEEPIDDENRFGFRNYSHLSDKECLVVYHDLIQFFSGCDKQLGLQHSEAFYHLVALLEVTFEADEIEPQHWGRHQLFHMLRKCGFWFANAAYYEFTSEECWVVLRSVADVITRKWTATSPIVVPEKARFAAIIKELNRIPELLFCSGRRIHTIAVHETPSRDEVFVQLNCFGSIVLKKTFPQAPELEELQKEIDAGPLDWEKYSSKREPPWEPTFIPFSCVPN
jgi:hypothetical protein